MGSSPSPARIIFGGSPDFAVPCLAALADSRHDVVAVLTQPDRPAGRGRKLGAGPVKQFAIDRGIDVLQPRTLAETDAQEALRALQPDLMVVVAYGLLLPPAVLEIPRAGCINVHASLLPRWRGAAPIQAAILAGDAISGVSIMQMEAGLDTGPVFATRELNIAAAETADLLHDRLAALGAELLLDVLDDVLAGTAVATEQNHDAANYASRINKADAVIDWHRSAIEIDRQVRAYRSWPVAETLLDGKRMRCWAANPDGESDSSRVQSGAPGRVVGVASDGIDVLTGDGILRLTEIQMPGKQRVAAGQFANGYPVDGKLLGQ
ncbi:MAG: methionyl-tRNA formyltransferase [Gammaproteobacteria bacterium]